jgi:hypothetical protein
MSEELSRTVSSNRAAAGKLSAAILFTLPSIVGTGFFLVGAIASTLAAARGPVDLFAEPTFLKSVGLTFGYLLFLACYFGAAFGWLALPSAAVMAFSLTRVAGLRSKPAIWAWSCLVLALLATSLFWGWLIRLDLFI